MRDRDNERLYPPGAVPILAVLAGLVAAVLLAAVLLIPRCSPEPPQMVPDAPQAVTATASAQVFASQSVRVTIKRRDIGDFRGLEKPASNVTVKPAPTASQRQARQEPQEGPLPARQVSQDPAIPAIEGDRGDEIVIEVVQGMIGGATSSAAVEPVRDPYKFNRQTSFDSSHGHLGVIAATMPGILAADLQLLRLDVSPVTRWLVDVPMEVGVDAVGNLEAGGVGVSAGGKAFALAGVWSRWNLSGQGVALGVGLRF